MWYTEPEIQEKGGITLGAMKMHHASGWMSAVSILTALLLLALVAGGAILLYVLFKGAKDRRSRRDNEALYQSLAEALKARRAAHGMSQEQVAEALGVSRQAVSKWENGTAEPSTSNLLALAPGKCVLIDGCPDIKQKVEAAGVTVYTYEGKELSFRGTGGPTCLTCPLHRV